MATKTITTDITINPTDLTITKTDANDHVIEISAEQFPAKLIGQFESEPPSGMCDWDLTFQFCANDEDNTYTIVVGLSEEEKAALGDEADDTVFELVVEALYEAHGGRWVCPEEFAVIAAKIVAALPKETVEAVKQGTNGDVMPQDLCEEIDMPHGSTYAEGRRSLNM